MTLVVLLGGARSGKSALAVSLAERWSGPVAFVATAEAGDEEMRARIERHRQARPAAWRTVEEPLDIALPDGEELVVLDCLTLWVANLLEAGRGDGEVLAAAAALAERCAGRSAPVVAVSNEVGLGVVPATPLGRRYRDLHGAVNRTFVERASRAYLVVAGRALPLDGAEIVL